MTGYLVAALNNFSLFDDILFIVIHLIIFKTLNRNYYVPGIFLDSVDIDKDKILELHAT